ncbi:hypothetical protein DV737_g130, partial [Chaetothyriales sp. CBS 132003]
MATIPIIIKHAGKKHNVDLDPTARGEELKVQMFSLTGVEPDRQTILIKGGKLKDDTELSKLNAKANQIFTMIGTASSGGSSLAAPTEKLKFVEDMTEAEAAQMEGATPAGLHNLGNTCYLNSTLQVLKSMPELQEDLGSYKEARSGGATLSMLSEMGLGAVGAGGDLVGALRDLYKQMSETQGGLPPVVLLNTLRSEYPQFAQKDKSGVRYAQQDAEEAWSQIIQQVRQKLRANATHGAGGSGSETFVDKFMAGRLHSVTRPPAEVGDKEPVVEKDESFLKIDCHLSDSEIRHLGQGIKAGLRERLEKRSETLGRDGEYVKESAISRLPKYLTVHMIRFFWKNDIKKKAKILKKVTFPEELDMVEYCTEDLRKRLVPVREKVREIRKDEQDMERARKRQKLRHKQEEDRKHDAALQAAEAAPIAKLREQKEQKEKKEAKKEAESAGGDMDVYKTDEQYEQEKRAALKAAKTALYEVIDPELLADESANKSGLYELRGVVCHQGASADSGHYTSYVKKEARLVDDAKARGGKRKEEDGKWWFFNDDKVSEVEAERIQTLVGGGEAASALILLYRAIPLPTKEEIEPEEVTGA